MALDTIQQERATVDELAPTTELLADTTPNSNRIARQLSLATLAVAAGWILLAVLVPPLIRSAYDQGSLAIFTGRNLSGNEAVRPLTEFLGRWKVFAWSGLAAVLSGGGLFIVGAGSQRRWLARLTPPVFAFILARALLCMGFAMSPVHAEYNHRPDGGPVRFASDFANEHWSRFDSMVYLSIARGGYQFYPCDIPLDGAPIGNSGNYCGNAAWFPGYPALIWALARFHVPELAGGVWVSAIFSLLTLFLLWTGFLDAECNPRNILCLALAALFPGAIYYHAVYPISAVTFFILLSLYLAKQGRWKLCGLSGGAAAFTYPPGAFLPGVFAVWVLYWFRDQRWRDKLRWIVTAGSATAGGLALVLVVQRAFTGMWGTFFVAQAGYKQSGLHLPTSALIKYAQSLIPFGWEHRDRFVLVAITLFASFLMLLLLVYSARAARSSLQDSCLWIFLLVMWLTILTLGETSLIRKQALLVPAVPLAKYLPAWLLSAVVAVAVMLVPLGGILYYGGLLW